MAKWTLLMGMLCVTAIAAFVPRSHPSRVLRGGNRFAEENEVCSPWVILITELVNVLTTEASEKQPQQEPAALTIFDGALFSLGEI